MSTIRRVQFIGGPKDGESLIVDVDNDHIEFPVCDQVPVMPFKPEEGMKEIPLKVATYRREHRVVDPLGRVRRATEVYYKYVE